MLEDLYAFKDGLKKQKIFFCFDGPISQDIMVELGEALKQTMSLEKASRSNILGVFSILVEQTQNIIRYSAERIPHRNPSEPKKALSFGLIAIGHEGSHYFILCGNKVANDQVGHLHKRLSQLQKMTRDEIRRHYRKQRRKKTGEKYKRGELGWIEVAKKAGMPIEFNFEKIDDNFSFFSVKTVI